MFHLRVEQHNDSGRQAAISSRYYTESGIVRGTPGFCSTKKVNRRFMNEAESMEEFTDV